MNKQISAVVAVLAVAATACGESAVGEDYIATASCPAGQTLCDSKCVDVNSSSQHCGTCGLICPAGSSCVSGQCVCQAGLRSCGGLCVNLATDGANCGACGVACPTGQVCAAGVCSGGCPTGSTQCGSSCVDLATDPANCGACGNACAGGKSCVGGSCSCPAGLQSCSGSCVDTLSDASNCGACGNVCLGGATCVSGVCTGGTVEGTGGQAVGGTTNTGGTIATGGTTTSGGAVGTGGQATGGSSGGGSSTCSTAEEEKFSFFLMSLEAVQRESGSPDGFGGDLGGLAGADAICQRVAEYVSPCQSSKVWHAFLSTSTEDAIDRIGQGPWYDRVGRLLANNISELLNDRPINADPAIIDDFPNEYGVPNHNPDGTGDVDNHEILTGSGEDGRLYTQAATTGGMMDGTSCGDGEEWTIEKATCWGWTSSEPQGCPRVGHSWPREMSGVNWISVWNEGGCAPGGVLEDVMDNSRRVGSWGGYGGWYCFAVTP